MQYSYYKEKQHRWVLFYCCTRDIQRKRYLELLTSHCFIRISILSMLFQNAKCAFLFCVVFNKQRLPVSKSEHYSNQRKKWSRICNDLLTGTPRLVVVGKVRIQKYAIFWMAALWRKVHQKDALWLIRTVAVDVV